MLNNRDEKNAAEKILVFVRTLHGSTIGVDVYPTDTVETLLREYCRLDGIPNDIQSFPPIIYAGSRLDLSRQINSYNIQKASTLHLTYHGNFDYKRLFLRQYYHGNENQQQLHLADEKKAEVNYDQSVHNKSIHLGVEKTLNILNEKYQKKVKNLDIDAELKKFCHKLTSKNFPNINAEHLSAAKRCLERILQEQSLLKYKDHNIKNSKFTFKMALTLIWYSMHSAEARLPNVTAEAAESCFINTLYQIQRGYNLDEQGKDIGGDDRQICFGGTMNKAMYAMNGILKDVDIPFVSIDTANLKLGAMFKEGLIKFSRETNIQNLLEKNGDKFTPNEEILKNNNDWHKILLDIKNKFTEEFLFTSVGESCDKLFKDYSDAFFYTEFDINFFKKLNDNKINADAKHNVSIEQKDLGPNKQLNSLFKIPTDKVIQELVEKKAKIWFTFSDNTKVYLDFPADLYRLIYEGHFDNHGKNIIDTILSKKIVNVQITDNKNIPITVKEPIKLSSFVKVADKTKSILNAMGKLFLSEPSLSQSSDIIFNKNIPEEKVPLYNQIKDDINKQLKFLFKESQDPQLLSLAKEKARIWFTLSNNKKVYLDFPQDLYRLIHENHFDNHGKNIIKEILSNKIVEVSITDRNNSPIVLQTSLHLLSPNNNYEAKPLVDKIAQIFSPPNKKGSIPNKGAF